MTVGVGGDVAQAATPEQHREAQGWHERFITAFGGAVVAVCLVLLGFAWNDGLRGSSFAELRSDIASGTVQEWYVAGSLHQGRLDLLEAERSLLHDETVDVNGEVVGTSTTSYGVVGEPTGGILVWRSFGSPGWQVAVADNDPGSFGEMSVDSNEASAALVRQLRDAGVAMRPFSFGDGTTMGNLAALGGLIVLGGLVMGAAPRVGTRWFWFWMLVNGPLLLGFIAYAVVELIGFRRRPERPLDRRFNGWVGFFGAFALGLGVAMVGELLRNRGVPLPL
ncbi:hypothetical protein [Knoellia subterranea]|uniref:Uncharacterized protein n=1 Tax=Knoellia subterranea KCTC 19937 TaxID=1385521 RepID=A0A0A0JGL2_9MICO|nr:hypothetical protein [Knoellia subterranea]KGN36288.1 hypothetical protein N803_05235 [Knoellia subterranea KCTC 19937]